MSSAVLTAHSIQYSLARTTPVEDQPFRIVVIGGGASGALFAMNLLQTRLPVQIDVVEPRAQLGSGMAYSTRVPVHLLNVPAARMSAFCDRPNDFLDWLQSYDDPASQPGRFAPRMVYGRYLSARLNEAVRERTARQRFTHHRTAALSIEPRRQGCARVHLRDGQTLQADAVVLALGNAEPRPLANCDAGAPWYSRSAWSPDTLDSCPTCEPVLLVGSGLTAVDALMALRSAGHFGTIHLVSRRGLLPRAHGPSKGHAPQWEALSSVSPLQEWMREFLLMRRATTDRGAHWRAWIDSLRSSTNAIWSALTPQEQQRFFRHMKTYWDVHRHRMAPQIARMVERELETESLIVTAGRVESVEGRGSGLTARIRRADGSKCEVRARRLINCTGSDADLRRSSNPFIRSLFNEGLGQPSDMGLGLKTLPCGSVVDARGNASPWLSALGPLRLGSELETTAIPEIRVQAHALALRLAEMSETGQLRAAAAAV